MSTQQVAARPRPIAGRPVPLALGDNGVAYLMLLPSVAAFALFVLFPVVSTFVTAFSEVDTVGRIVRVGSLKNVQALAEDQYLPQVIRQTVIFVLVTVGLTALLSFALALILNSQFRGRELAKALILIPWAMPYAVAAITWRWIFHGQLGALNYLLMLLGVLKTPVVWLSDPTSAFAAAMLVEVWSSVPFMTVTFLAGMQAIPPHIYDAAKMDGAGPWQEFRDMTLPQMRNVIMIVTLLSIIWAFRSFGIIWVLTRGDPVYRTDLVVTYLYKLAFQFNNFGAGFAVAVGLFAVLLLFSIGYLRLLGGREEAR